jgi:hypothetical protein
MVSKFYHSSSLLFLHSNPLNFNMQNFPFPSHFLVKPQVSPAARSEASPLEPVALSLHFPRVRSSRSITPEENTESRDGLVGEVKAGYAGLEPFVRAKTHYHRAGFIV